jgi:hypothetical protein
MTTFFLYFLKQEKNPTNNNLKSHHQPTKQRKAKSEVQNKTEITFSFTTKLIKAKRDKEQIFAPNAKV